MTDIVVSSKNVSLFVAAMDDEGLAGIVGSNVAATDTTVYGFIAHWGAPHDYVTADNGVTIFIWNDLQVAKGKRRGDLYVSPVDGGSMSYFGGEI